ncbi:MAG: hypothetical protein Q7S57_01610 [bacterium]|nr:hypothetical protein [bacterium]
MSTDSTTTETITPPPVADPTKETDPRFPLEQIIGTEPMKVCKNWADWLDEWQSAGFFQRLGLLEVGLLMPRTTREVVCQQFRFFVTLSDYKTSKEPCIHNVREWGALSAKASEMLVREVFTNNADKYSQPSWSWLLDTPELFETVLWYFRPRFSTRQINLVAIDYTDSDESKAIMRKFLRDFCRLAWTEEKCEKRPWLAEKRPQMVPILCGLGGPAIWEATDQHGVISFDDECLKALEQTVLSVKVTLPRDSVYRFPKNVQDSVNCGVECARVLLVLQAMATEELRYTQIDAHEERIAELRGQMGQLQMELAALGGDLPDEKPGQ